MTNSLIRRLIVLGGIAILGIISLQSHWTFKTYDIKEEQFHESVMRALRNVAQNISDFNETNLPKQNVIQRRSSNNYAVNVNSAIDANVLESYLYSEFNKGNIIDDFEYAVYDCASDDLVYGQYCNLDNLDETTKGSSSLPKFDDLVYYFVVRFPSKESYLIRNMWQTILFNIVALMACLFFIYTMWVILKQKRLSELQKDFINNMTHEFKTPISSIKIASEVFAKDPYIAGNQRLRHYTEIIKDQNNRLNHQVEKVLNIARSEKSGFQLNKEEVDLNLIVSQTVAAEKAKIHQNDANIELRLSENSLKIEADELHLTNVIANIIDNAIKYCQEKPSMTITTGKQGKRTFLRIADNGVGIKEEELKKVQEKFYRVPTGDVHNVKGFGLGLFYVRRICAGHGWQLKIESTFGHGTDVSILF